MTHNRERWPAGDNDSNEARAFAEALLGKRLTSESSAASTRTVIDRERLEFLAEIAPDAARNLLRSRSFVASEEWDEDKHPRLGGPPNAGWFANTGGAAASSGRRDSSQSGGNERREFPNHHTLAQALPPIASAPEPRNPFGVWPDRPARVRPGLIHYNGMPNAGRAKVDRPLNDLQKQELGAMLARSGVIISLEADDRAYRAARQQAGRKPIPLDAGGVYDSRTGIIHIFDKHTQSNGELGVTDDAAGTLRHEIGHAVDHSFGDVSMSADFRRAVDADRAEFPNPAVKKQSGDQYALSHPQEAFAEAFARQLGGTEKTGALRHTTDYIKRSPQISRLFQRRR